MTENQSEQKNTTANVDWNKTKNDLDEAGTLFDRTILDILDILTDDKAKLQKANARLRKENNGLFRRIRELEHSENEPELKEVEFPPIPQDILDENQKDEEKKRYELTQKTIKGVGLAGATISTILILRKLFK